MKTLTKYDPFNELTRFEPMWDVNDVLSRFMLRPFMRSGMEFEPQIKLDVKETDGMYTLTAEIPGVKKEDIHVTCEGSRVSISAEIKQEKESKEGERWIRTERTFGMASRTCDLGDEIDPSKVVAKYTNGVLELTLPKKTKSMHKEITIS
jgi:HSP20 family protein